MNLFFKALWQGLFVWVFFLCILYIALELFSNKKIMYSDTPSLEQSVFHVEKIKIYNGYDTTKLKGRIVAVCVDEKKKAIAVKNGFKASSNNTQKWLGCSSTQPVWMKRVVAVAGDFLEIKNDSVYVNNGLVTSRPYKIAFNDRVYVYQFDLKENIKLQLGENDIFLLGDHRLSFDSRYVGLFKTSQVKGLSTLAY